MVSKNSTGSITGGVRDPKGAVIPGVKVGYEGSLVSADTE